MMGRDLSNDRFEANEEKFRRISSAMGVEFVSQEGRRISSAMEKVRRISSAMEIEFVSQGGRWVS